MQVAEMQVFYNRNANFGVILLPETTARRDNVKPLKGVEKLGWTIEQKNI